MKPGCLDLVLSMAAAMGTRSPFLSNMPGAGAAGEVAAVILHEFELFQNNVLRLICVSFATDSLTL